MKLINKLDWSNKVQIKWIKQDWKLKNSIKEKQALKIK